MSQQILQSLFPGAIVSHRPNKTTEGNSYQVRSPLDLFFIDTLEVEGNFISEVTLVLHNAKVSLMFRNHGVEKFSEIRDILGTIREDLNRTFQEPAPPDQ